MPASLAVHLQWVGQVEVMLGDFPSQAVRGCTAPTQLSLSMHVLTLGTQPLGCGEDQAAWRGHVKVFRLTAPVRSQQRAVSPQIRDGSCPQMPPAPAFGAPQLRLGGSETRRGPAQLHIQKNQYCLLFFLTTKF